MFWGSLAMCLAIPARIVELQDDVAVVDLAGNRVRTNVSLLEDPALGDDVLVHAGFAITKLSPEDARETFEVFQQLEESLGDRDLPEAAPDDR